MENKTKCHFRFNRRPRPLGQQAAAGNDEVRTPLSRSIGCRRHAFPEFLLHKSRLLASTRQPYDRTYPLRTRCPRLDPAMEICHPNPAQYLDGLTCYTDVLAENDYTVGLSGKWHLGDSLTPQHGFSHWFRATHRRQQIQRCRYDPKRTGRNATRLPH